MPQSASFNTTIKTGGTPASYSNEACAKVTANTVYRVSTAAKRVIDPDTSLTVQVDASGGGSWVTANPSTYTVDYFTGTITFGSDQGSSALVRISSGKYIPLHSIAHGMGFGLDIKTDELDITEYGDSWRRFLMGMTRGDLTIDVVSSATDVLDGGSLTLQSILEGRAAAFVEYQPGGQGRFFRFWAKLKEINREAPVDGLIKSTVSAVLTTKSPAAAFSSSAVATS